MKQIGIVKEIDKDITTIELFDQHEDAASCSSGNCATCHAAQKRRTYSAINSYNISLRKGSLVEVELPVGKAVGAFFRVFIFPVILFIAFYFLVSAIWPAASGLKIVGGFTGLILGFGLNFLISPKMKKKEMPVISRIYQPSLLLK